MKSKRQLSRREFLKLSGLSFSALALPGLQPRFLRPQSDFPLGSRLGRVTDEGGANLRTRPSSQAPDAGRLPGDTVVEWLREVVGYTEYRNQRWVETPQGYIWAPLVQPVMNLPNEPLESIPDYGSGPGLWMEVTVPYVDVVLANPPARGFRIQYLVENFQPIRFYYRQVFWVDGLRAGDQGTEYHVRELHGARGDEFWAPAEAFKPINPQDVTPISPEVDDKLLIVNISRQTLSCVEAGREVHFCRVSTGDYGEGRKTPVGDNLQVFMKYFSIHMEGGSTGGGYDLSGISWATFIATGGIAVHSTYWHNNFGERTSAGCVNASPEDARFVFRWSNPEVPYYPGTRQLSASDQFAGTRVRVVEV
ncbi:MAG: L,D-transpeptidase [Anaerolineales bacterium]